MPHDVLGDLVAAQRRHGGFYRLRRQKSEALELSWHSPQVGGPTLFIVGLDVEAMAQRLVFELDSGPPETGIHTIVVGDEP